ncbi:MAG: TRAP transporter large permease subunit [Ramlibacter sp.]
MVGLLTEVPAAILLLAEMLTLLAGVVSRYVFHQPLVWTDEFASFLFIWLAMLGAAIAVRRGAHMRMTTLLARVPGRARSALEALAVVVPLLLLASIAWPAMEHTLSESVIHTPYLDISTGWRVAALPVGIVLMLAAGVVCLLRLGQTALCIKLLVGLAVVAGLLALAAPTLRSLGNINLFIFFVVVVFSAVFAGVPIAFSFGIATLSYLAFTTSTPLTVFVSRVDEGMSHLILLSVPMFVLLGYLMEMTGMAQAMISFLASLLGHVKGGLAYVLLGAMYLVSGISGSKAADMAAITPALFPEMKRRGYKPGDLVALLSASGAMSETIPPSLVLITIGSVTGVSIAALFTGGMLPALLLALALGFVVWRRYRHEDTSGVTRHSGREIARLLLVALPALGLPFIIRAAVVEGVATATEVSTVGVVYCVLAGVVFYRKLEWRRTWKVLIDTASMSGAILLIIGSATAMGWALIQSGFSRQLTELMIAMPGGRTGFLLISIVAFIMLGSILEGSPAIVLFAPLLFPIAKQLGIHEVHYSMVVVIAMGIGLFAPPFGVGYYGACAMGEVDPDLGMRPLAAYMFAIFLGLVLLAFVPWFSIGFLKP